MQLRGTQIVVDTVAAKKQVISGSGATRTLNEYESGSTIVLDKVDGTVFTLPEAKPGMTYEFITHKAVTSNSHKIITNITTSTPVIIGAVDSMSVVDNSVKGFQSLGATANCSVTMNGTTTGGRVGTRLVVTAISSGTWFVTGLVVGSGTLATPFATS